MIRIPQVRVIDDEGNQLGIMPTPKALEMAQEKGLDLVEVAPMASPPVTRFLDFGQYKYELTKKEKEAKRRQRSVTFKEVRLSPKIGIGDFETKVHRAIEFLEDGDRIKVTVRFRGRELTHPELGRNLIAKFTDQVKDHGIAERTPLLEGKSMFITMASTHKPKNQDVPARPGRPADGEAPEEAASTEAAPAEAAPTGATPVAAAPKAAAPKAAAPKVAAPEGAAPAGPSSNGTAPKGAAPKADVPVVATPAAASPAPEPATTGE
jgi:translation initiation factor IF-3